MTNPVHRLFAAALLFVQKEPPIGFTVQRDEKDMDDTTLFVVVALALLAYYFQGNGGTGLGIDLAAVVPGVQPPVNRGGGGGGVSHPELPAGFDSDPNVARDMLINSMNLHGIDPVAAQGHGNAIVAALRADYPTLDVYAHNVSDAIMWPGFGSLDVTIDSGLGGWYFRPDGQGTFGEGR